MESNASDWSFLFYILHWPQGERVTLERALESVAAQGLLEFLDSPPTIHVEGVAHRERVPLDWQLVPKLA